MLQLDENDFVTYMERDTAQVDDLFPLRPVVGISGISRWKRVQVNSAMALDQVVAVFRSDVCGGLVKKARFRSSLDVLTVLLTLRVLRGDFVIHGLVVRHL